MNNIFVQDLEGNQILLSHVQYNQLLNNGMVEFTADVVYYYVDSKTIEVIDYSKATNRTTKLPRYDDEQLLLVNVSQFINLPNFDDVIDDCIVLSVKELKDCINNNMLVKNYRYKLLD